MAVGFDRFVTGFGFQFFIILGIWHRIFSFPCRNYSTHKANFHYKLLKSQWKWQLVFSLLFQTPYWSVQHEFDAKLINSTVMSPFFTPIYHDETIFVISAFPVRVFVSIWQWVFCHLSNFGDKKFTFHGENFQCRRSFMQQRNDIEVK